MNQDLERNISKRKILEVKESKDGGNFGEKEKFEMAVNDEENEMKEYLYQRLTEEEKKWGYIIEPLMVFKCIIPHRLHFGALTYIWVDFKKSKKGIEEKIRGLKQLKKMKIIKIYGFK